MAGTWKVKKKVECSNCGWIGMLAFIAKPCPKCKHWYPKQIEEIK